MANRDGRTHTHTHTRQRGEGEYRTRLANNRGVTTTGIEVFLIYVILLARKKRILTSPYRVDDSTTNPLIFCSSFSTHQTPAIRQTLSSSSSRARARAHVIIVITIIIVIVIFIIVIIIVIIIITPSSSSSSRTRARARARARAPRASARRAARLLARVSLRARPSSVSSQSSRSNARESRRCDDASTVASRETRETRVAVRTHLGKKRLEAVQQIVVAREARAHALHDDVRG